jgi:hypothetical protein
MDDWRLLNESAAGLRIVRPLREGVRIGAGLLIAVKVRKAAQRFTLASVRWALREGSDSLAAGIQLFPGEPKPAAIRILDPGDKAPPGARLPAAGNPRTARAGQPGGSSRYLQA